MVLVTKVAKKTRNSYFSCMNFQLFVDVQKLKMIYYEITNKDVCIKIKVEKGVVL